MQVHRVRRARRSLWRPLTAFASALLLLTAACTQAGDKPGTLSVIDYYTDGASNDTIGPILERCGERAGVRIERQSLPRDQLMSKTLQLAAARDLPGLLMLDNPDLQQIAQTGALNSLDDLGVSTKGYYSSILSAGTYAGQTYALPLGVNTLALFYNKKLFREAGLQPPRTWQQLRTAAAKLTQGSTYGIGFASPPDEEGTWQFEPFLWSNGGDLSKLNQPQALQALQMWTDFVQRKQTSKSVVNWTQDDVADQFASEHVAMMVNGSWMLSDLDEHKNLDYGVVPLPVPRAGDKLQVALGGEVWTVPKTNPETQQTAARVLSCMSERKNMLKWANGNAVVPTRPDVARDFARGNPAMRPFAETVPTARARTEGLGPRYPKVSQAVWTALQEALIGSKPPQAALRDAQHTIDQLDKEEVGTP